MAIYVPPFANVRLIECRDFIALAPVAAYREFYAYGRKKAREVTVDPDDPKSELFWDDCTEEEEVWAVMQWTRYEDGHEEQGSISYLLTRLRLVIAVRVSHGLATCWQTAGIGSHVAKGNKGEEPKPFRVSESIWHVEDQAAVLSIPSRVSAGNWH